MCFQMKAWLSFAGYVLSICENRENFAGYSSVFMWLTLYSSYFLSILDSVRFFFNPELHSVLL